MLLGLDHLVVAVTDPDAAAAELEASVGLTCTGGGRHPAWGTFNRLPRLGDTDVELTGPFARSIAPNRAGAAATGGWRVGGLRQGAPLWNPAVVEIEPLGFAPARAALEVDAVGLRWR